MGECLSVECVGEVGAEWTCWICRDDEDPRGLVACGVSCGGSTISTFEVARLRLETRLGGADLLEGVDDPGREW